MKEHFEKLRDKAFELTEWEELNYDNILEKFGELIVKECARVASDYEGAHYVGTVIEEHFGVK